MNRFSFIPPFVAQTGMWSMVLGSAIALSACGAKQSGNTDPAPHTPPVEDSSSSEKPPHTTTIQELPARCQQEACINTDVTDFDVDGIRVIVKRVDSPPLTTATLFFEGGALDWTPETAGYASLALDIAVEGGPASISRDEYRSQLEQTAASISRSVGRDNTSVYLFSPAFAVEQTFALMSDALLRPAFRRDQVKQSTDRAISHIQTRYDNVDNATAEVTRALAWKDHPYALHPSGEMASVQGADETALRASLQNLLKRERMLVVFAGDITDAHARTLVKKYLSDIPHDPDWAQRVHYPDGLSPFSYDKGTVDIMKRDGIPTNYILGYFAAPALTDPDYPAMVIATRVLRNELFKEVRTRRNLTYAVSAALAERRANTGALYVTTTKPKETLRVMYDTIDALIQGNFSQDDVNNEILSYLTHHYMDLQSFDAQADLMAQWSILTGDRLNADRFIDAIHNVTKEDVQRVLDQYVRNIQYGIVGDPTAIDEEQFTAR